MTLALVGPPAARRPEAYPEDVRERAFRIWVTDGRRSHARTARLLAEHLDDLGIPLDHPPDRDTIRKWSVRHNWAVEAQAALANSTTARFVLGETIATFVYAQNLAMKQLHDMIALDVEVESNRRTILDASRTLNEYGKTLREWGTRPPDVADPTEKREPTQRSRDEIAAEQLARIQKGKQEQKGKH